MTPRKTDAQRLLARNVWRLRELRKMNAATLAERMDWPLVEIEALERAEKPGITLDDLSRLAEILSADPFDLLRRSSH